MIDFNLLKNRPKYRNKKCVIDGIKFDSQKESLYYMHFKSEKENGNIIDFKCQVPYVLHPGIPGRVRPIKYIADFVVTKKHDNGVITTTVYDVKSPATRTQTYILKKKLMMIFLNIEIEELH